MNLETDIMARYVEQFVAERESGGASGMTDVRDPVSISVEEAIEEYRQGKFVIIADDEDRENEGDLTIPAECVTPETINFMARYAQRADLHRPLGRAGR